MKIVLYIFLVCLITAKKYKFGLFYKNTGPETLLQINNTALLTRDAFTEEIWIKSAESTLPSLFKVFASSQAALQITPSSNLLELFMTDSLTYVSLSGQITHPLWLDTRWNYVMMQYNGRTNATPTLRAQYNEEEIALLQGQLKISSPIQIVWTAQGESGMLVRGYRLWHKWLPVANILTLRDPTVIEKMTGTLAAYYPLDEPQLTHFDYSKFARHFAYASQKPRNDVTPDYIERGEFHSFHNVLQFSRTAIGPEVPVPPSAFDGKVVTVDMWLAFTRTSTYFIPIVGIRDRVLHYGFEIIYDAYNSRLLCHFLSTVDYNPPLTISFTPTMYKWYHYACVNTLTYSQVLVNAEPMKNASFQNFDPAQSFEPSLNLVFGRRHFTMQETMCGFIREFRMWNEGLDGWHLKKLMHQRVPGMKKASLVMYYTFGDNTGRMLFDQAHYIRAEVSPRSGYSSLYSSTDTDFSYIPIPSNMTRDLVCDIGSTYDFAKGLCYSNLRTFRLAYLGNSRSTFVIGYPIGLTTTFTVELWVYPTAITGKHLLYKLPSFVELGFTTSDIFATFVNSKQCKYTQALPTNKWSHLGYSYTHSSYSMTLFYNGDKKVECTTADIGSPAYPLSIAQLNFCGESATLFVGYVTNFRVWNKAISTMKFYYKRTFSMNSDLHYNFMFDEGFGDSVRDQNNPSSNALFLSNPQWDILNSYPEVCAYDSYFNGSACASDFRVPVVVDSSSSLLMFTSICFNSIGNLMFWFFPLVQNLDTQFSSVGKVCLKLSATANQLNTIMEGTVFPESPFTFPTLNQWHHISVKYKAYANNGYARVILNGSPFTDHTSTTSTCIAITDGSWTFNTAQAYFRSVVVTDIHRDDNSMDSINRYNPCEILKDKYCLTSVYTSNFPLDDGMGVPYLRNLVSGQTPYSSYLTSKHKDGIVWKSTEPLIICSLGWIYDPETGVCKKQNPIPMESITRTTGVSSSGTLLYTYTFWFYVPDNTVSEVKLISFFHRNDNCLSSVFYCDTVNSLLKFEFFYRNWANTATISSALNLAITQKGKWHHLQGMIQEVATGTASQVYYNLQFVVGIRQHPSISTESVISTTTVNARDMSTASCTIQITLHPCASSATSCSYHMHDLRVFNEYQASIDPYYPEKISSLKIIWEYMTPLGKISIFDSNHALISITPSLIDTSLTIPIENLDYYDEYTETGTARSGIIQNSIKSLKITSEKNQPLYIPIEGKLSDNSCWTIEAWVFANPEAFDDDAVSTLFGVGNTVNCFHELRINKGSPTAILGYTTFGTTPTATSYSSVSLTASSTTWNYLYLQIRNHTGSLEISYGGFYNDLQGSAVSAMQTISDLGVTGKYKYLVLGENPLASSSRTKGVYFKSVKLWDIFLSTLQIKRQAYQPISRDMQSSRLISAFDFSKIEDGEAWDMGYHSCSVAWLKSYMAQEASEVVRFSEFHTTTPQDEIDTAPINFMGKGGQYLYRNILQSTNLSRSLHITASTLLSLKPVNLESSREWSVEFWVKVIRLSGSSRLIYQDLGDSSFAVMADTTSWYLQFRPMRITDTLSMEVSSIWLHFSMVNSLLSSTFKLSKYSVEGHYTSSAGVAGALNLSSPILLGVDNAETHYNIKEFRVFRYPLTDVQVDHFHYLQIDPVLHNQLVLYYRFDEGDGTVVFDPSRPGVNSSIVLNCSDVYLWDFESDLSVCAPGLSYNSEYMVCSDGYSKYYTPATLAFPLPYVDSQTVQGWVNLNEMFASSYFNIFQSSALLIQIHLSGYRYYCFSQSGGIYSTSPWSIKKWDYIACVSSPLYSAFLYNEEYKEAPSNYGYSNRLIGRVIFPSVSMFMKNFQLWNGVRSLQQILESKNRYYYSYPQLLMYAPLDEEQNSINFANFEEQTTAVSSATFVLNEHIIFPIINSQFDQYFNTLNVKKTPICLQLPSRIWYLIRKSFMFRLWVKLVGSSVSSPIILFAQNEVLSIKILSNLSLALDLVNPETEEVHSLVSPNTLSMNYWNLLTISKNSSDNFMFAVNTNMNFQYYPFMLSLNQSYNYTSYIYNPNNDVEIYLKELYLVDDYLTPLQHTLLLRNKIDVRQYPKSSYVYYSMDGTLSEDYLFNQATHYQQAHTFSQSISYKTILPPDATWVFDSSFPKLCSMNEKYVDGHCIPQEKTLWFDGSNSYKIQFPITPITVEYSWEMWIYLPVYTATKNQFILGIENSKELYVYINSANTKFRFYGAGISGTNQDGDTYCESYTTNSNALQQWTYIIVGNSKKFAKSLVYGSWMHTLPSEEAKGYFPHVEPSQYLMTLGSETSSCEFEGGVRELRIFGVYRGAGAGLKHMGNVLDPRYEENLLHYFRLHESLGLIISDYSYNQATFNVTRKVSGKSPPQWIYIAGLDMLSPEISSNSYSVEPEFTFSQVLYVEPYNRISYTLQLWVAITTSNTLKISNGEFEIEKLSTGVMTVKFSNADSVTHSFSTTDNTYTFLHIAVNSANQTAYAYVTNFLGEELWNFFGQDPSFSIPSFSYNAITVDNGGERIKSIVLKQDFSMIDPSNLTSILFPFNQYATVYQDLKIHSYYNPTWLPASRYAIDQSFVGRSSSVSSATKVYHFIQSSYCYPKVTEIKCKMNCTVLTFNYGKDISFGLHEESQNATAELCEYMFTKKTMDPYFGPNYTCNISGSYFNVFVGENWNLEIGSRLRYRENKVVLKHCPFSNFDFSGINHYSYSPDVLWHTVDTAPAFSTELDFYFVFPANFYRCSDLTLQISRIGGLGKRPHRSIEYRVISFVAPAGATNISDYAISVAAINSYLAIRVAAAGSTLLTEIAIPESYLYLGTTYTFRITLTNFLGETAIHTQTTLLNSLWPTNLLITVQSSFGSYSLLSYHNSTEDLNCSSHRGDQVFISTSAWEDNFCTCVKEYEESDYLYVVSLESPASQASTVLTSSEGKNVTLASYTLDAEQEYRFSFCATLKGNSNVNITRYVNLFVANDVLKAEIVVNKTIVWTTEKIELNASAKSRDYNFAEAGTANLVYYWNCINMSTLFECYDKTGNYLSFGSNSATLTYDASIFNPGFLNFTLYVIVGTRISDTTSQIVEVRNTSTEILWVKASVGNNTRFNLQDALILHIDVQTLKPLDSYSYYWSLPSLLNNYILFNEVNEYYEVLSNKYLYAFPYALKANVQYSIVCSVYYRLSFLDNVTFIVTANSPPSGGVFSISPSVGKEYSTNFSLYVSNWADSDLPLTYSFFYRPAGESLWLSFEPINNFSTFPSGPPSLNYQIEVRVKVRDSHGGITNSTVVISVYPQSERYQLYSSLKEKLQFHTNSVRCLTFNQISAYLLVSREEDYGTQLANLTVLQLQKEITELNGTNYRESAINLLYVISKGYSEIVESKGNIMVSLLSDILEADLKDIDLPQENPLINNNYTFGLSETALNLSAFALSNIIQTKNIIPSHEVGRCIDLLGIHTIKSYYTLTNSAVTLSTPSFEIVSSKVRNFTAPANLKKYTSSSSIDFPMQLLMGNETFLYVIVTQINRDIHFRNSSVSSYYHNSDNIIVRISLLNEEGTLKSFQDISVPVAVNFYRYKASYPLCMFFNESNMMYSTTGIQLVEKTESSLTCNTSHLTDFTIFESVFHEPESFWARISFLIICIATALVIIALLFGWIKDGMEKNRSKIVDKTTIAITESQFIISSPKQARKPKEPLSLCEVGLIIYIRTHCYFRVFSYYSKDCSRLRRAVLYATRLYTMCSLIVAALFCDIAKESPIWIALALPYIWIPLGNILESLLDLQDVPFLRCEKFKTWIMKRLGIILCGILIIAGIGTFILWDLFNGPHLRRLQSQCLIYSLLYDLIFHQLFNALILTMLFSGLFGNRSVFYKALAKMLIPRDAIQGLQDFFDQYG